MRRMQTLFWLTVARLFRVEARLSPVIYGGGEKKQFCYSMDGGEYYTGRYDTREAALEAALENCEGYHSEVHTAQIKDWPQFIDTSNVGFCIADYVNDCLDEDMLPEEMVLRLDDSQFAELGELVVNWLKTNVKAGWYSTEDVQSHDVEKEITQ